MKPHYRILPTEPRCRPFHQDCGLQDKCARHLASRGALDEKDFSKAMTDYGMAGKVCHQFLSVQEADRRATAKPVKPWPKVDL